MFFALSKILTIVLEPLVHPFLLLLVAAFARWRKKWRLYRVCLSLAVILPLAYGILPPSIGGIRFLENRFPVPVLDARPIDGIIVLGGHTGSGQVSQYRGHPQQTSAAERLTMGIKLHRQYPDVPILFSGFSGQLFHKGWSEADIIRRLLDDLDVPMAGILFEESSRNTYENAVRSRQKLLPQPGSRWILVTSALHMPRAMSAFSAAGWKGVIAYPVDYRTGPGITEIYSLPAGMSAVRSLLHEIVGLIVYRLTGRGASLLPRFQP